MLLAAQLTTAFGSSAAVRAIATPMTITLIVVPDMQLLSKMDDALPFALAGLSDVVDSDLMTDVS